MNTNVNSVFFGDCWASGGANCCGVAEKTNCDVSEVCSQCQFCGDGKWKTHIFSPIMFKFGMG